MEVKHKYVKVTLRYSNKEQLLKYFPSLVHILKLRFVKGQMTDLYFFGCFEQNSWLTASAAFLFTET